MKLQNTNRKVTNHKTMNSLHISILSLITASLIVLMPASRAAVIFSDNFTTGNLTSLGWYSYNASGGGTAWTISSPTVSSPLVAPVMRNAAGTQANTLVIKQWSAITLANTGDYIQISLDFQTTATPTTNALQVVLFNTSYIFTGNIFGVTSPTTDANGYAYQQSWGQTSTSYREVVNDVSTVLSTPSGLVETNNNSGHTLVFTLTRVATGLQIDASMDTVAFASYIDTTPSSYSYNSVKIGSGVQSYFDNITVTAVPEPSSAVLILGALGGLCFVVRRRSHGTV